jgi:hypothetical protein
MILVFFAITPALTRPTKSLADSAVVVELGGRLHEQPVISLFSAVILSDCFSLAAKHHKTSHFWESSKQ